MIDPERRPPLCEADPLQPLSHRPTVQQTVGVSVPAGRDPQRDVAAAGERVVAVRRCGGGGGGGLPYTSGTSFEIPPNGRSRFASGRAAEQDLAVLVPVSSAGHVRRVDSGYSFVENSGVRRAVCFGFPLPAAYGTLHFEAGLLCCGPVGKHVEGTDVAAFVLPGEVPHGDGGRVERRLREHHLVAVRLVYLPSEPVAVGGQVFYGLVPEKPLPGDLQDAWRP